MAPKKKPIQRRTSQNPNTVLVVFLIFFILGTILAGVAAYYGYAGQELFKNVAAKADAAAKSARRSEEWALFQSYVTKRALGGQLHKDEKLDEENFLNVAWENYLKDGKLNPENKFKEEPNLPEFEKLFEDVKESLEWDPVNKKFKKNYRDIITAKDTELKKVQAENNTLLTQKKAAEEGLRSLQTDREAFYAKARTDIKEGNQKALDAAIKKTDEMSVMLKDNTDLRNQINDIKTAHDTELRKERARIHELQVVLDATKKTTTSDEKEKEKKVAGGRGGSVHALLLDVSKGKALWDTPVGKIIRVIPEDRKVYINLGRASGVKPQMTFNVFGAGWSGRAEGSFKGTVEVLSILDATTSVARVTSLYDAEGQEIAFNATTRGTLQRQGENPLKEGDLLFSLTWGSHVAVAGNVSWDGYDVASPAEQRRQLRGFLALLEKEGITVDAWVDPTDGKIQGAITAKTNYVIRGEAPLPAGEGKDDPNAKIAATLGAAIKGMQAEAVERGLFVISADNFLNVIGYRRPRPANDTELSGFRPALPAAPGTGLVNPQVEAGKE